MRKLYVIFVWLLLAIAVQAGAQQDQSQQRGPAPATQRQQPSSVSGLHRVAADEDFVVQPLNATTNIVSGGSVRFFIETASLGIASPITVSAALPAGALLTVLPGTPETGSRFAVQFSNVAINNSTIVPVTLTTASMQQVVMLTLVPALNVTPTVIPASQPVQPGSSVLYTLNTSGIAPAGTQVSFYANGGTPGFSLSWETPMPVAVGQTVILRVTPDLFGQPSSNSSVINLGVNVYANVPLFQQQNLTLTAEVTLAPPPTISYDGSPYCSGSGFANVTAPDIAPGSGTYSCNGLNINPTTGQINLAFANPGTYTVFYRNYPGTVNISTNVTINGVALPTPPSQMVCAGQQVYGTQLPLFPGVTYSWTNDNPSVGLAATGIGLPQSFTAQNATPQAQVAHVVIKAASGTCESNLPYLITVNATPVLNLTYGGNSFCNTGFATPNLGAGNGTYSAQPQGLSIDSYSGMINLNQSAPGTYVVTYTTYQNCGGVGSTTISVGQGSTPPQILNSSVPYSQVCPGTNVILTQTGGTLGSGAHWQWYTDPAFTVPVGGQILAANAQLTVSPATTTLYYLRAEGGTASCLVPPIAQFVKVGVTAPFGPITITGDQQLCGNAIPQSLTAVGIGYPYQWQSATDPAFQNNLVNYPFVSPMLNGSDIGVLNTTRYFRARYDNGCEIAYSNTVTITIRQGPLAQPFVLSSATYCNGIGSQLGLAGSETGTTYQLARNGFATGAPVPGTGGPVSFGMQPAGLYIVTAFNNSGCLGGNYPPVQITSAGYFTASISAANALLCSGSTTATTISITGGPENGSVNLSINGGAAQSVQLDASGNASFSTGNLTANTTYAIESVSNGSCATPSTASVTVYVGSLVANPMPSTVLCAGQAVGATTFTGNFPAGTQFNWTASNGVGIGFGANSGTGSSLPAFTATNSGLTPVVSDITVTPILSIAGCAVRSMVYRLTVNPRPTVDAPGNQVLCAGSSTAAVSFSGNFAGTTYSWINSNSTIGMVAAGTGTVVSFIGKNNLASGPNSGTFTVTPFYNSCAGTPAQFTITVNKGVVDLSYPQSTYCPTGVALPNQTGSLGGLYTALPAGLSLNGTTGAVNLALSAAGTYTITYTLSNNGGACGGIASTVLTVQPKSTLTSIGNLAVCANSFVAPISFVGTADVFTWTNSNPSIGLPASGSGAFPGFIAQNATSANQAAQINVVPGSGPGLCSGAPMSFRILVYARPVVDPIAAIPAYCRGMATTPVTFTSATAGTTYSWTNSNTAIGLTAHGTGSLPSFVAQNPLSVTSIATITVTPANTKCPGDPASFTLQVGNCVSQSGPTQGGSATGRKKTAAQLTVAVGNGPEVVLAPNPALSSVLVNGKSAQSLTVQLLDAFGRPVDAVRSFTGSVRLSLSGLASGAYLVQVTDVATGQHSVQRLVKL